MNITYIIYGIIGLAVVWIIWTYNRFVTLRYRVREAWSDIEVQLKRRYDLIPNVVETVKGYMTHERETLQRVTDARTQAMGVQGRHEKAEAENALSMTLKTLFAVSENYPDLKANANFLDLQRELADTENKIQAARRFYNINIRDLNTKIESFPANIIANVFRFKQEEFFEAEAGERENVKISF